MATFLPNDMTQHCDIAPKISRAETYPKNSDLTKLPISRWRRPWYGSCTHIPPYPPCFPGVCFFVWRSWLHSPFFLRVLHRNFGRYFSLRLQLSSSAWHHGLFHHDWMLRDVKRYVERNPHPDGSIGMEWVSMKLWLSDFFFFNQPNSGWKDDLHYSVSLAINFLHWKGCFLVHLATDWSSFSSTNLGRLPVDIGLLRAWRGTHLRCSTCFVSKTETW